MDKKTLRLEMKKQLASMNESEFIDQSRSLSLNLSNYIQSLDLSSCCVGVFSPIQREPLWFLKLSNLDQLKLGMVQIKADESLGFYNVESNQLSKGVLLNLGESQLGNKLEPDVILVPGLAFSKEFERLGRGGGYYDKYLKMFKGEKIGVCFDFQVLKSLPVEKHDILMNKIITDKDIY